jgi:hypothetical protein
VWRATTRVGAVEVDVNVVHRHGAVAATSRPRNSGGFKLLNQGPMGGGNYAWLPNSTSDWDDGTLTSVSSMESWSSIAAFASPLGHCLPVKPRSNNLYYQWQHRQRLFFVGSIVSRDTIRCTCCFWWCISAHNLSLWGTMHAIAGVFKMEASPDQPIPAIHSSTLLGANGGSYVS